MLELKESQLKLAKRILLFNLWDMKIRAFSILSVLYIVVMMMLLLPHVAFGEPRSQIVQLTCPNQVQQNNTAFVTNFVASMEVINLQMRTQGNGVANSGQGPDAVYALAQCYGDLSLIDCVLCYSEARTFISQCFPYNGARIFLDGCFMRTGNYSFFNEYSEPEDRIVCGNRTRKNPTFEETARQAFLQAASFAPNNNGYARADMPVSGNRNESAYVLANCWSTIDAAACKACLENATNSIQGCLPWSEGRALNTGCFMRYSDTNFLNPIPRNSKRTPTVFIAVIISSTVVVAGAAVIGAYIWQHKRIQKKRKGPYDMKKLAKTLRDSSLNFKYSILEKATGGFQEANKLGQGGFGTVYKGILQDGREVAVKRLFFNNKQRAEEFYNEVNLISSVEHKNLVRLLGCSCCGPESLLVYEFLPNKSLDHFIFGLNEGETLNWEKRFDIIIGIAEGLVYLHENTTMRIIHRDIKASNILLDTRLRAKIADFGLARSFQDDKSHISTVVAGTLGYLAPEYLSRGQLTEKADVYSFGVLLMEIVTGRQNNNSITSECFETLVTIAWKHFQQGTVDELIDRKLVLQNKRTINVKHDAPRVIHVALLCTQEIPSLRPSMSKALQMLAKMDEHLPTPTNPPFIDENTSQFNGKFETATYSLISSDFDSVATVSQSIFNPR